MGKQSRKAKRHRTHVIDVSHADRILPFYKSVNLDVRNKILRETMRITKDYKVLKIDVEQAIAAKNALLDQAKGSRFNFEDNKLWTLRHEYEELLIGSRVPFERLLIEFVNRTGQEYRFVSLLVSEDLVTNDPEGQDGIYITCIPVSDVPPPQRIGFLGVSMLDPHGRLAVGPLLDDDPDEKIARHEVVHLTASMMTALAIFSLLECANVSLVEAKYQHPRGHQAYGVMQYEIAVRQSKNRYKRRADTQQANYSHRFEVRGNFAHHYETKPDGTENQLFTKWAHDHPEKIIEHAGRPCIRIWRPPYVKGPSDKPLVPKVRHVI